MKRLFVAMKRQLNSDRSWSRSTLALILAAVMLLSVLSPAVFAESYEESYETADVSDEETVAIPGSSDPETDAEVDLPETAPETEPETDPFEESGKLTETVPSTEPETTPETAQIGEPETISENIPETTPVAEPETDPVETETDPTSHVEWTVDIDGSDYAVISGVLPEDGSATVEPTAIPRGSETTFSAYDLTVYDGEGEVYASDDAVSVELHSEKIAETLAAGNSVGVLEKNRYGYFQSAETVSVCGDSVKFLANENSTYYLYANQLVKTLVASDGNTYRITVLYDNDSGFPEDAEIRAEELTLDDDYLEYLENTAATLGVELSALTYNRLFDISVVDGEGNEYQPNDSVRVTVEMMEDEAESVSDLRVVHFGEDDDPTELDAKTSSGAVTFDTDGFSIFSFNDTSLASRVINAVFGERKLYENDDIVLTGRMPLFGVVEATPVEVEVDGRPALVAYDITIYANSIMKFFGIPWQPSEGAVQVTVKSEAFAEGGKTFEVYHMQDEQSEPEFVASVDAVDSSVTFEAESFSIYPIVEGAEGGNARIGYRFWYYNGATEQYEEITTQYFRFSDVQNQGSKIYEPSVPGMSQSEWIVIFEGWHKGTINGSNVTLQDPAITVTELNDELQHKAESEFVEGTIIDIIAKLRAAYYITYVDVNPNNILSTDLVLKAESGDTYFSVKSGIKPTRYEEDLKGWKLLDEIADDEATLYEPGSSYVINSNITLAPVIEGGYWLVFDDNDLVDDGTGKMVSGGASYTPATFYMNNSTEQNPTVKPSDPEWTGYEFGGWYEDAACTIPFTFGDVLTKNTTVYAKWTPAESSYTVIIWKQPTDPNATQYDFDQSFTISEGVKTGDLVYLDNSYTKIYGEDGTSTDLDKQFFTYNQKKTDQYIIVKANGTSVLNVYYDRVPMTMNFYIWDYGYVYTETTSDSGTQYGIVDGEYVLLTKKDGESSVYNYTYSPRYTPTDGNNGTQYGIIDGEYKELDREADTAYRLYYTYTPATGTNDTQYGVVDGEFEELVRRYTYTYEAPVYGYTTTTGTSGTQYALIDGEYVELIRDGYYNNYDWYYKVGSATNGVSDDVTYQNEQTYYRVDRWGDYTQLYYSNGAWRQSNGTVHTGDIYQQWTGIRYTRTQTGTETTEYDGTLYYYRQGWGGGYREFTENDDGSRTLYARVDGEYYELTRSSTNWYVSSTNAPFTGNRYTQTRNNRGAYDYTGKRYIRPGYSAPYTYTETTDHGGTQYGVTTVDNGHVRLEANTDSYSYYYNGEEGHEVPYDGIRYTVSTNVPTDYNGTLYTLDDGVYHVTTVDSEDTAEDPRYGKDDNGVFRPLHVTVTNPQVWSYTKTVDGEEKSYPYTGTRYTRSANQANSWQLYKQFVGVYGATLEQYGYTWPMEYNWFDTGYGRGGNANTTTNYNSATTGGSRMTIKTTFEPLGGELDVKFYGNTATASGRYVSFITQNLDGSYSERNRIYTGNDGNYASFHINDKYAGFHAVQYRADGSDQWQDVDSKGSDGFYGDAVSYRSYLEIRFDRTEYPLVFFPSEGAEPVTHNLPYETSLVSYRNESPGQKVGHYFVGWYADDAYTTPFDFNQTMPDHPVSVYGYWRMERIRVVCVVGADNVYVDPSQALAFRKDYDERIEGGMLETITRTGYTLDGWYTDPNFTNKFLFSTPVNSTTEGVDMTYQTAPRWAAARASYGDDDEAHENVRGILVLYAKWIVNTSEKGVNVIYDPGEAALYNGMGILETKVPVDPRIYQDGSDVVLGSAPNDYSELYYFGYWEIVDSEGNVVTVDGVSSFAPGTTFNVNNVSVDDAFKVTYDENNEVVLKTIKIRAHYTKSEEAAARYTTITYDGDTLVDGVYPDGTATLHGKTLDGSDRRVVTLDKEINSTIILPSEADFYLDGYTLVGWSFFEGTYKEQVDKTNAWNTAHPDDKVWIFTPAQKVAADNLDQNPTNDKSNILYAMWQPKYYTVTVTQVVEDGVAALNHNSESFTYTYKSGVENAMPTSTQSLTLDGDAQETYKTLSANSNVKFQYYGRLGHVFNIQAPSIDSNAEYSVIENAFVLRDDGTLEPLTKNVSGNYEILGDVEIIFTYAPKVDVTLEKRALNGDKPLLEGSKFVLTPVHLNDVTHRWDTVGTDTFEFDMTDVSSLTKKLQEGYYRVEETQAPTDYAKMSEPVILQVRKGAVFTIRTETGAAVSEKIAKLTGSDSHTLTIYDRPIRTVKVTKTVNGDDFEPNGYTFSVTLKLEGSEMKGYDTVGDGLAADTTNSGGIIEFKLKNGESKELRIPWGAEIEIKENTYVQYDLKTIVNGASDSDGVNTDADVSFTVDNDATVNFVNIKKLPAPTQVTVKFMPFIIMDIIGLALFALVWTSRKKRRGGDSV